MKAISVRQPFAEAINGKDKTIELRTWRTDYRGKLLICSSKSGQKTWLQFGNEYKLCPMGATICVVDLVDCRPATKADAEQAWCEPEDIQEGMWAWVFKDATDVVPKPIKGKLNFFDVDDDLIEFCGDAFYDDFYEKGTPNFERDWFFQMQS